MNKTLAKNEITLQELLQDTRFQEEKSEKVSDGLETEYSTCINLYIKGRRKSCLEKMFSYGMLTEKTLFTSLNTWKLFLSASCDTPFDILGVSLQDVIGRVFSNPEIPRVNAIIGEEPLNEQVAVIVKYLDCCLKYSLTYSHAIPELAKLEDLTMDYIVLVSSKISTQDDVRQLRSLVEFYIIDLQVGALRRKKSEALYEKICDAAPKLSTNLHRADADGLMMDVELLNKLKEAPQKKPKKVSRRRKSKPPLPSKPILPALRTAKKPQLEPSTTLRLLQSVKNLFFFRHNSRVMALVIIALLFSLKRAQTISIITNRGLAATRILIKYIYNIIQLLI